MKRLTYFLVLIFISSNSFLFSQSHNQVEVDLERIKKDIIDLQKFVYKNSNSFTTQQNESSEIVRFFREKYLVDMFLSTFSYFNYIVHLSKYCY